MIEDRSALRKKTRKEFSAGGIVYRKENNLTEILLILPARRNDPLMTKRFIPNWTFPKGWKGDHGDETDEQTAVREVKEEGGVNAQVIKDLGPVSYFFNWQGENVQKTVHWFLMKYQDGNPSDHDEEVVDAKWVPLGEVESKLNYKTDKEVFAKAIKLINAG